jgi:hypothetical protein
VNGSLKTYLRRRFVRWYMGRIAGRYCPCEWPIKSKRLMHLCGRIDDAYERENFRDSVGFIMGLYAPNTTSSTAVSVEWKNVRTWRRGH